MDQKKPNKAKKSNLKLRTALLFLQILLPFGLYAAMQWESSLASGILAGGFVLSMGAMVWLG